MSGLVKFVVFFLALAIGNIIYLLNKPEPVPHLRDDTWWGAGEPSAEDKSIRPFKISVPDEVLNDLNSRLKNHRPLVPPLEGTQQQYGINTNLLKKILDYWQTKYDWREREKFLNKFSQYKTSIQGLDIHFLHVKPRNVPSGMKILPLIIIHGWPGSVREFYELIPLLTTPQKDRDFVFEIVAPSLPGYGFSEAASKPGLSDSEVAVIFNNLMKRLGFQKYYVQGGDWGSAIGTKLAILYPDFVKGVHLNFCMSNRAWTLMKLLAGVVWPRLVVDKEHEHRLYPLSKVFSDMLLEFGYMHLQATKPDSVGVSLTDSPAGLAAYMLEKFTTWTNPEWKNRTDGGLTEKFTYTKLLDNVMIYWVTSSITTSMRLYAESINSKENAILAKTYIQVPSACAIFDNEIIYQPESFLRDRYTKLVQANEYKGGHFAAFEVPESLAKDVWLAVEKFEKFQK